MSQFRLVTMTEAPRSWRRLIDEVVDADTPEGLSISEVAEGINESSLTVSALAYRARTLLRKASLERLAEDPVFTTPA